MFSEACHFFSLTYDLNGWTFICQQKLWWCDFSCVIKHALWGVWDNVSPPLCKIKVSSRLAVAFPPYLYDTCGGLWIVQEPEALRNASRDQEGN